MIMQVLPKIVLWIVVIGIAYVVVGRGTFDSPGTDNPLQAPSAELFLPPAKPERLIAFEQRLSADKLQPDELSEYLALSRQYQDRFWKGGETTVEQALSGVQDQRARHLSVILEKRGLSTQEQSVFFTVVKRDYPQLLEDRE